MVVTPANVADVTQAHALLHGEERDVFADAGYQGVDKREEVQDRVEHIFGVLKCIFRYTKVRYKGLRKNAAQITTLLMLANFWMARRQLMQPCVG